MRKSLILITLLSCATNSGLADKDPAVMDGGSERVGCSFVGVTWIWDGSFSTETCDTGGLPVWQYGLDTTLPQFDCDGQAIGEVLGTVLGSPYPNNAGERAILGSLEVTSDRYLMEICHAYVIEPSYDGGNVEIITGDDVHHVVEPIGGYPDAQISDSGAYYAWCVDLQPGFTGIYHTLFSRDCFDLSPFMGQTVQIAVKFGSDNSSTNPGWYISSVVVGGDGPATDEANWGTVKSIY